MKNSAILKHNDTVLLKSNTDYAKYMFNLGLNYMKDYQGDLVIDMAKIETTVSSKRKAESRIGSEHYLKELLTKRFYLFVRQTGTWCFDAKRFVGMGLDSLTNDVRAYAKESEFILIIDISWNHQYFSKANYAKIGICEANFVSADDVAYDIYEANKAAASV